MDEEVDYIAYKICELIDSGIDINNIKLTNVNSDYYNTIDRIFKMYNLPINIINSSIYGTDICNFFIDNYNGDISITINKLKEKYNSELVDIIIDICNKYAHYNDYNKVQDIIINDLKNTLIPNKKLKNKIDIIDYKNDYFNDEYVFMLSFNQENIPVIYKDEDYISDILKDNLLLDNTVDKNKQELELTIKKIKIIKNLIITYKLKTPFNTYFKSNLINILGYNVEHVNTNKLISFSNLNNKLKCGKMLDDLVKYGSINNDLDLYYNNYKIDYNGKNVFYNYCNIYWNLIKYI